MYNLTEMTTKWSEIRKDFVSHLYEMKEHLAKIFYYRDFSQYLRGWKAACRKGFEEIPRQKEVDKYPSFEKIYECLWTEREDIFNKTHKSIIDDLNYDPQYDDLPTVESVSSNFKGFCEEYIRRLCLTVSHYGGIGSRENSELIDELLKKWKI